MFIELIVFMDFIVIILVIFLGFMIVIYLYWGFIYVWLDVKIFGNIINIRKNVFYGE